MTLSGDALESLYTTMVRIRRFDEKDDGALQRRARQGDGAQLRR